MEEFEGITGPGKYRLENGYVHLLKEATSRVWQNGVGVTWNDDGSPTSECISPVVAGPLDDRPGTLGLSGFAYHDPRRGLFGSWMSIEESKGAAQASGHEPTMYLDLSTIKKDQLVKPQPNSETSKLIIAFWDDGSQTLEKYIDQYKGHRVESRLKAIKEVEVDYTHGEGLNKDR